MQSFILTYSMLKIGKLDSSRVSRVRGSEKRERGGEGGEGDQIDHQEAQKQYYAKHVKGNTKVLKLFSENGN